MMNFFKSAFRSGTAPVAYQMPKDWAPAAAMDRVILHWTAGSYIASSLDKQHYHFLVEGDSTVVRGKHSVTANQVIGNKSSDHYAAHTKGTNTRAIGIAICAMAGAVERPFNAGAFPIRESQWNRAIEVIACLCRIYNIAVTPKTVLTHAEVQTNLGNQQDGKWDVKVLPFNYHLNSAKAVGDHLRERVKALL